MKEEAVYQYQNDKGYLVFETVRFEGNKFRQRRYGAYGKVIWDLKGVTLLPYRYNEWRFDSHEDWLFIPEGERDTDRLWNEGLPATTNPPGAGKWRKEYNCEFQGRRVCLLSDNDSTGHAHVKDIATNLLGIASEIVILYLPDLEPKGDISDWLETNSVDELLKLVNGLDPITLEDVDKWKEEASSVKAKTTPPKKTSNKKDSSKSVAPAVEDDTSELMAMKLDLKELFLKVVKFISARISISKEDEWILAAFTMNTHVFEIYHTTPYILLESAAPACGKTTAIQVLHSICNCPKVVTSPTQAVLFRMIEKYKPTLLSMKGNGLAVMARV